MPLACQALNLPRGRRSAVLRRATIAPVSVQPSDEVLACAFAELHDERAFTELFYRHNDKLYRFLLRKTYSREDAADIGQMAWIKLVHALGNGRYRPRNDASFKTYLYTLANNCRIDIGRIRRIRVVTNEVPYDEEIDGGALAEDTSHSDPANTLQFKQLLQAYGKALRELPETQRITFLLREDGDLSLNEIAGVTNVPFETAKSRLADARKELRAKLGEWL